MAEKIKIGDTTRKAVLAVLNQQKGDFSARKWGTLEHAMGTAYLAEICGIGMDAVIDPASKLTKEQQQDAYEKACRKEFVKEWLDGWSFASNLAKKLAHDDIKLLPAKATAATGEYE